MSSVSAKSGCCGYGWVAAALVAFNSLSFLTAPSAKRGISSPFNRILFALGLFVAAGIVWLVERRVRVSAKARPDGLVVRNSFRTYRIPWADIDSFGKSRSIALKDVRLTNGRRIKMQGVEPGSGGNRAPQDKAIAELLAYRATALELPASAPV
jgi:hypothetical protein